MKRLDIGTGTDHCQQTTGEPGSMECGAAQLTARNILVRAWFGRHCRLIAEPCGPEGIGTSRTFIRTIS